MYQIRKTAASFQFGNGFRDELVVSGLTLSLLVVGSFAVAQNYTNSLVPATPLPQEIPQTLGATDIAVSEKLDLLPSPTPMATLPAALSVPEASLAAIASEGAVVAPVVPFGEDGFYDFTAYSIGFKNPRVVFDPGKSTARKLVVEVELTNKTVMDGLNTQLAASIVKDGVVIVPKAVMHVPNRQQAATNQQATYQAELTLIEATDVRELRYEPGGDLPTASHFLYQ